MTPVPAADGFIATLPGSKSATWLNHTAVIVLELSNGTNSSAAIAEFLADAYQLATVPTESVQSCLEDLLTAGLINYTPGPTSKEHHVLVCVTAPDSTVNVAASQALAELPERSLEYGYQVSVSISTDQVTRRGWNDAASSVAQSTVFTHVLFLDSATTTTADQLRRALDSGHDVVSFAPPRPPLRWDSAAELASAAANVSADELASAAHSYAATFERSSSGHKPADGFLEASTVAVNGLLVSRNALLRIAGSELVSRYSRQWSARGYVERHGWGFFEPVITADGDATDEEASFSTRWRSIGGKIWVDLSGSLGRAVAVRQRVANSKR